jgi:hypothetical protein
VAEGWQWQTADVEKSVIGIVPTQKLTVSTMVEQLCLF